MLRCLLPSHQQPIWLLAAVITTMVMAISGCVPAVMPPPPPVQDESLVTGKPCLPPCWYGIVPSQTTVEEAIEIVTGLPFVAPDSVTWRTYDLPKGFDEAVDWQYVGATHPTHGGVLYVRLGLVARIRAFLPRALKLADVLATQGEPDSVLVRVGMSPGELPAYYFDFFYSERGLWLTGSQGHTGKEGEGSVLLSPDIAISEAQYLGPMDLVSYLIEMQGHSEEAAREIADFYQPWPGLGQEIPVP